VKNNLKELYNIQQVLVESDYHDISRISKEIQEYCIQNAISPTKILNRIQKNEPWEYIKGSSNFLGEEFLVNRNTLIPRIETEELVSIALKFLQKNNDYKQVIDVGTGSGCIIIFLAKNLCKKNNIKFLSTDTNSKALQIAKENSVLHKVNKKVAFLKTNLIKDISLEEPTFIVANLPYIPTDMYKKLDKSVINFEPKEALEAGKDGLKYYKELLEQIKENGEEKKITLLIEIEPSTLESLKKVLEDYDKNLRLKVFEDFRKKKRFVLIHLR